MGEFDDDDDDFGDLYADVEAQASSAMNVVHGLANDNAVVDDCEKNGSQSSESEDDLDIVLNDNNDNNDHGDHDSKSKSCGVVRDETEEDFSPINECVKTRGSSSSPGDAKADLSSSISATGGWDYYQNACGQFQGSISGQGAGMEFTRSFGPSQRRSGFSLPSYRSILDVNIDSFEEKPWRYPGVDITDFFNFGLDEDTWKRYCNHVDQFRLSAIMPVRNGNCVSENHVIEVGNTYGEQFEEPLIDDDYKPKGRAIQVEDGNSERLPTADVRCPYDRDCDVVIQINLEDPIEDTSDGGERLDDHSGSAEPNNRSLSRCDGGVGGDEVSSGSSEENDESVHMNSAKTTTSNPVVVDLDDSGKNLCDHDGEESHQKNSFSSDKTVIESVKKSSLNVRYASVVETEIPLEEKEGQLSLTSSCFGSDSEAFIDSSQLDSRNTASPVRQSSEHCSDAEFWENDTPHQSNLSGKKSAKVRPVDSGDSSKCRVRSDKKKWIRGVGVSGSVAEDIYEKDHLSVNSGKRRSHRDRKDIAYYENSERSYYCVGRELAKSCSHTTSKSRRRVSQGFHEERYLWEDWKERSEGRQHQRGPNIRDVDSGKYYGETHHRDYRYSYTREEMDSRSIGRNDKLQCRKFSSHVTRCKQDDSDFILERYGRCGSNIEEKRDASDHWYESSFLKRRKRSIDVRCRLEQEDSWYDNLRYQSHQPCRDSGPFDGEYPENVDDRYYSGHSFKEYDRGRWTDHPMSPTNDVPNSGFMEQETRQLSSWEGRDGYTYNNSSRKGFCFRRSQVLPWTDEEVTFRYRYEKPGVENPSFFSKNNSHHRRAYFTRHDRRQTDDDKQSDQLGRKIHTSNANCRLKNEQAFVRWRDSENLNLGEGKEYGRCHRDRDSASFIDSPKTEHGQFSAVQAKNKDSEIEEGQIVVAEAEERSETKRSCELDDPRILESLAKMEKRRERFKEPITLTSLKNDDEVVKHEVVVATIDVPQQRPARKRQWCSR